MAQEALSVALRKTPTDGVQLRTWLARVVRNLASQTYRTDSRRTAREAEVARSERTQDHAETLAEAEAHQSLVGHVIALDERDRELLLQRYFQGRSVREIAVRESKTQASISSQLTRAHGALRRRLEAQGGKAHWLTALAPLVGKPGAKETALAAGGGTLVGPGLATAMALLFIGLLGGVVWLIMAPSTGTTQGVLASAEHDLDPSPIQADPTSVMLPAATRSPLQRDGTLTSTTGSPEGTMAPALAETEDPSAPVESLPFGTDIHVLSVDEAQASLPHKIVVLCTPGYGPREFGRKLRKGRTVACGRTDEMGRMTFEDVKPGNYMIGVLNAVPIEFRKTLPSSTDLPPMEDAGRKPLVKGGQVLESIRVPPNTESIDTTVTHWSAQTIEGRIIYPDGSPADDVLLLATLPGAAGSLRADTNSQGAFSFGGVAPGRYRIFDNMAPKGWCMPDALLVDAGTTDLRIVLQEAAEVSGSVLHPDPNGEVDGWVWLLTDERHTTPGTGSGVGMGPAPIGTYSLDGLTAGTYTIFTYTNDQQYFGWTTNEILGSGESKQAQDIQLQPAAQLRLTNQGAVGTVDFYPTVNGVRLLRQRILAGEVRDAAMPPGRLTLRMKRGTAGAEQTLELELVAGEVTEATY